MIYKATVILSLLFLTLSGSAQSDVQPSTLSSSGQPQSAPSSATDTVAPTQVCPSGGPPISLPTASDGVASGWVHGHHTRPSDCQSYSAAMPTMTGSFQQPPSGALPSGAPDSSLASMPVFSTMITGGCQPYTIPTGTETVPPSSGGPSATPSLVSEPPQTTSTISLSGTQPDSSTPPGSASSQSASSSGPPVSTETATTSHVGRRRLVRRQV